MKKSYMAGALSGLLILVMASLAGATAYTYSFSVGGGPETTITPLSGTESATQYYDYYSSAGHPDFGPEAGTAFFWLYEETNTGNLSLNVIFNKPDGGGVAGDAYFTLSGLPGGWSWIVQDDGGDIGGVYDTIPTWTWLASYTDGGVIGGLEDAAWDIGWTASSSTAQFNGVSYWYFLSDGSGKHDNPFSLVPGSVLTVSAEASPVPEPATMLLLGSGLAGLAGTGLRRKRKAGA